MLDVVVDTAPRGSGAPELVVSLKRFRPGAYIGFRQGKNLFVQICDRCHEPGLCVSGRWYHEMPFPRFSCSYDNAPRPAPAALQRTRDWYKWAQGEMRKKAIGGRGRLEVLEGLVSPMRSYLLEKLVIPDRRNLPSITECMMIHAAMVRTEDEHFIDPVRLEEWLAKSST